MLEEPQCREQSDQYRSPIPRVMTFYRLLVSMLVAASMIADRSASPVDCSWGLSLKNTPSRFLGVVRLTGGQGESGGKEEVIIVGDGDGEGKTICELYNLTEKEYSEAFDKVWDEIEQENLQYNLERMPRIIDEDDDGQFTPEKASKGLFNLFECYMGLWPDRSSKNPRHVQKATIFNYSRMDEPNYVIDQMAEKCRISADYSTSSESSSVDSETLAGLFREAERREDEAMRSIAPKYADKEQEAEVDAIREEIMQDDNIEIAPQLLKDSSKSTTSSSTEESSYLSDEIDLYKRFRSRLPMDFMEEFGELDNKKPWDVHSELSSTDLDSKTHSDDLDPHGYFFSSELTAEPDIVNANVSEGDQELLNSELIELCRYPREDAMCPKDHVQQVLEVLKAGGQINVPDGYLWTPLHHAAFRGHDHIIRMLVHRGASIEAENRDRNTPLLVAVRYAKFAATRMLMHLGANWRQNGENIFHKVLKSKCARLKRRIHNLCMNDDQLDELLENGLTVKQGMMEAIDEDEDNSCSDFFEPEPGAPKAVREAVRQCTSYHDERLRPVEMTWSYKQLEKQRKSEDMQNEDLMEAVDDQEDVSTSEVEELNDWE
ncbi:hypothetical protein GUITHDRAFT_108037 [Guillardia theta CCMP2712]|uniref:Uncharacterized protein n=1 Tax=Guillardia theta (strain CCMP2712) TaxID=905079 RepID=L1JBV1_GUITC|nr:hypothetical protein GUITHDRAFT_108037 [Guillardia theta CCMP2712]EKX45996.1 hypothetical protein GUITHDRAFT_108037 [Guillardia theta CCMP2712]|eukprot:XP_005832976.1 hypothetical protein GUITHDRAFT_108037 [Guillardia theta CCMP2712]